MNLLIFMVYNFCRKKLKFQPIANLDRFHIEINPLSHNDDHYVTIKDCDGSPVPTDDQILFQD